jgi:hypothetical protein
MNIIQKQTDEFIRLYMHHYKNHRDFIDEVKDFISAYNKTAHQIESIERINRHAKIEFDKHYPCPNPDNCQIDNFYENTMFFLQEEIEELESLLEPSDFSRDSKTTTNETLQKLIEEINKLKLGQQIIYDDFSEEFEELKSFYYLNRKNWAQLLAGKITTIVAGGIVNETVSKDLIELIETYYQNLILNP